MTALRQLAIPLILAFFITFGPAAYLWLDTRRRRNAAKRDQRQLARTRSSREQEVGINGTHD